MQIPFMRLDRQYQDNKDAFLEAIDTVFSHGRVLQGPEVAAFEQEVATVFGMPHGVAVGSGTDALVLALKGLGLAPGGRVAVTSLTFVASASAICLAGGVPVFLDVEDTYYFNREDRLLELIESGTVDGVIVVDIFGQLMDLSRVARAARHKGVFLIEDAAQALGATLDGQPAGRYADAVCVSFDPMKVVGAQGSGGMVLTRNEALAQRIGRLRYHGHEGGRVYREIGHNSQLPTMQAAILSIKLSRDPLWRARRQDIASAYTSAIKDIPAIEAPQVVPGGEHVFHKYVMRVREGRDSLAAHLKAHGVGTSVHYSRPLHTQPCFEGCSEVHGDMSMVERLTGEVLSLPIYPELRDEEVGHVTSVLRSWPGN